MARRARTFAVAAMVAALTLTGPAAAAQSPLPEQADPAVELLSPTLFRTCGVVVLAVVLGPVLVPLPVPEEVLQAAYPATGPLLGACGSVPIQRELRSCAADVQARTVVDAATYMALGLGLPFSTDVVGLSVDQLEQAVESTQAAGVPVDPAAATATADEALACET